MDIAAAAQLIAAAVPRRIATWADLGAGTGAFTRALASLLAPGSHVIALDRDASALHALQGFRKSLGVSLELRVADFLEALDLTALDGVLLANALHFVPEGEQVRCVARIARSLRDGEGRLLLVDYDGRAANEWVPYPVPMVRFNDICDALDWPRPTISGERPSRYGGAMYAAYVDPPAVVHWRPASQ